MPSRRRVLALIPVALLLASGTAAATSRVPLPAPTGRHPVATRAVHVVDSGRSDPWAPAPGPRELMVQLWYPTPAPGRRARYADRETLAALESALGGAPGSLDAVTSWASDGGPVAGGGLPLVLVSHGYGGSRFTTTALAEDLASHGYLVASVDHTHEAAAVRFPDGRVVRGTAPGGETPAEIAAAIRVRADDLGSVLTHLVRRLPVDRDRVAAIGHSAGGATAFEFARADRRVRAAVDLDGDLSAPVTEQGARVPALLLTGSWDFPSWAEWHAAQRGWGRHLAASGMGHYSFTDAPYYVAPAGLRENLPPEVFAELFGTVTPERAIAVQRELVRAFLDRRLRGTPTRLFDRESPRYPEITIRRR